VADQVALNLETLKLANPGARCLLAEGVNASRRKSSHRKQRAIDDPTAWPKCTY
jgi:hypothetical protein